MTYHRIMNKAFWRHSQTSPSVWLLRLLAETSNSTVGWAYYELNIAAISNYTQAITFTYAYQSPNSNRWYIESVGCFWWPLWNWARSRCGYGWLWVIKGCGLHYCEEFLGTKMGRERLHKDEEKHWEPWRALWNLQMASFPTKKK